MEKKSIYYGWWIVIASVVILAFMWALPISCFSLFITPITTEMNYPRASFGLCSTIVSIVAMLVSPFLGKWIEKYNIKIIMGLSTIGVVIGFLGYSFSTSLFMFYASAFIIGISLNGSAIMAISIIIKNWFIDKRGLATSIALAGSGVGGTIFSPSINKMIINFGWRNTYRILAVIIVVIILPIIIFFIQKKPEDRGLKPLGFDKTPVNPTSQNFDLGLTLGQLKTKPMLWIYVVSSMFIGFAAGGVLMQTPSYLQSIGYSSTIASYVVSAYLAVAVAGKILLGLIYDKKGSKAGVLFGSITFIISAVCLLFAGSFPMLVLFSLFYGFGTCNGTVTPSVLTSKVFGSKHYGEIYGFVNLFCQLGLAAATPVIGAIYDSQNSYTPAWILSIVLGIVALFGLLYSIHASKTLARKTNPSMN